MVSAKPRRARCRVLESMSIKQIKEILPHLYQVVAEQKRKVSASSKPKKAQFAPFQNPTMSEPVEVAHV